MLGEECYEINGHKFVETLQQLGYSPAEHLDGSNFDWLFEHDALQPFLQWFCSSCYIGNVLTPEEHTAYCALESCESGVLEGAHLERALQSLQVSNDALTDDQLRDDILQLTEDITKCKKQKKTLIQQRNQLSSHLSSRSSQLQNMSLAHTRAKEQYTATLNELHSYDNALNTSLETMSQPLVALIDLYKPRAIDALHSPTFLSQCELDDYHKQEAEFTQQLTAFTKKQFFEGIANMAGQNETCRYEVLNASDPQLLLVREESHSAIDANCKEFTRLQAIYPASERQYINSVIATRAKHAVLSTGESLLSTLHNGTFTKTIPALSQQIEQVGVTLSVVKKDIGHLTVSKLKPLIDQNSSSQVSSIVTGDYDLKITRQDYFTSNQDQVIKQLLVQRARNEFLTMTYEVQARSDRDLHRLIELVRDVLSRQSSEYVSRMKLMNDTIETHQRCDRTTVHSRDTATHRLAQLIDGGNLSEQHQLYVSHDSLADRVEGLCRTRETLQSTLSINSTSCTDEITRLENGVGLLKGVIYAGSSTTTGQPHLTPLPIRDSMAQLENLLEQLEAAIKDIVKDIDSKNKVLQRDTVLVKERKLWMHFFTDPERLEKVVEEAEDRLESLSVS